MPTVSEALEVLKEEDEFWCDCYAATEFTEVVFDELKKKIEEGRKRLVA